MTKEQIFWELLQKKGFVFSCLRGLLYTASFVYAGLVELRNLLYDRHFLPVYTPSVPVISVGNLTVGGVGKTPMVEYIARGLLKRGKRPVILSRGYGAPLGELNDEAKLLQENLPEVAHLQGKHRVSLAKQALAYSPTHLILDDGFQHRRLGRTLDLVLLDSTSPFGGGYLLPRGKLREPLSALQRADLICLTRSELVSSKRQQEIWQTVQKYTSCPRFHVVTKPTGFEEITSFQTFPLTVLSEVPLLAFSGIGNPKAFQLTLERQGLSLLGHLTFPDHHLYTEEDIAKILHFARQQGAQGLVTTQKDKVKLLSYRSLFSLPCYVLRIKIKVKEEKDFWELLLSVAA